VALHLRRLRTARHQQGAHPTRAQVPAFELSAVIGYINGGAVAGLPQTADRPVFPNPAQATTVTSTYLSADRVREVTRPRSCSLQRRRSTSNNFLVNSSRIRATCHSEWHSRQVRYSVLDSKNRHNLEPPYGIEP
jgi:hypothetical protein